MRSLVIDPVTLRRHYVPKCSSDALWELLDPQTVAEHEKLARRRTELDWALTLPDQFPSLSRTVVRELMEGDDDAFIFLDDCSPSSLNASISALGLRGTLYAETRSSGTVLRKVPVDA